MRQTILMPGLAAALAFGLGGPLAALDPHHDYTLPDEIEWGEGPDFIEPGSEMTVLAGNPAEGAFTARLRLPEGYAIHAHTHPEPKFLTVIEGAMHIGFGEELDTSDGTEVPAGGFVAVPAGHMHYEWFEEETVLQVHMNAPIVVDYVDPARDPRN